MPRPGKIRFYSLRSWNRWVVQVLAIAALYCLAGRLATLLNPTPVSAVPIWPASGIALAALLVSGYRPWPGILLGSFLFNMWGAPDAGPVSTHPNSALLPLSIGAGASVEALVGTFLIRRFGRAPAWFLDAGGTVKFLIFASISCVIGATWGTGSLLAAELIQWGDFWFSWCAWFVGDSIGIVTLTPLILIWAVRHPALSRRRQLAIAVPLSVAFCAIGIFFAYTATWERDRIKLVFERRTDRLTHQVQEQMQAYTDVLRSVEAFYSSSPKVTRQDFGEFTSRWLARYSGIGALSWIPRVVGSEREPYEQRAQADGIRNFQIIERSPDGRMAPAGGRAEYFPAYFVESAAGHRRALGYDLGSDPIRREALDRARDSGLPTASDPLTLIGQPQTEPSFVVLIPVYKRGLPHDTVEQRRKNLEGYVSGAFQTRSILASLQTGSDRNLITVRFTDAGKASIKAETDDASLNANGPRFAPVSFNEKGDALIRIVPFELAGRRWVVEFVSAKEYIIAQRRWQGWTALGGGLFFASLLTASLLILTGHAARLQLVNAELGSEMRERESAEHALRHSNALNSAILEAALGAIITMDHNGNIVEFNPAAERTFGYTREEAIGKPVTDLITSAELIGDYDRKLPDLIATRLLGRRLEMAAMRKDGSEFPIELAVTRIHLDGPPLFTGYLRDITQRKRAHEGLNTLAAIVQSSDDAIFSTLDGTITSWNRGAEMIYGYSASEIVGRSVAILFPRGRENELAEILAKLRRGENVSNYETVRVRKDGTELPLALTISPTRDAQGNVIGGATIARDISAQKRAEAELNQLRDALAHVTRVSTMGELSGSLAHEINQPLAAILSNAQAGQRFLAAGHVDVRELAEILDEIVEDNCRAVDVIRKMRALVKREKLDFATLDLKALIADVILLLHGNCVMRNVRVVTEFEDQLPQGYGDKVQLQQVIMNLLLNAFDAMKDVPEAERVAIVRVEDGAANLLTVSVSDRGSGIPADKLEEIFQSFYTTKAEGLGLGLSISRSIIAAHGGCLTVEPNKGRGVTFYFTVPIAQREELAEMKGAAENCRVHAGA
ncbi:MAG TPA: PAS domain S-box protein [Candidatus Binatia bacterium]